MLEANPNTLYLPGINADPGNHVGRIIGRLALSVDSLGGSPAFLEDLHNKMEVDTNGVEYAALGDADDSTKKVNMMPIPFGQSLVDILPLAELVDRTIRYAGVRDSDNKPLPTVLVGNSGLNLSRKESLLVQSGDFGPVVDKHLDTVKGRFPAVENVDAYGCSLAGALAVSVAKRAFHHGIKVDSVLALSPGNSMPRSPWDLLNVFMQEATLDVTQYTVNNPELLNHMPKNWRYWAGIPSRINRDLVQGMARGRLMYDCKDAVDNNKDIRIRIVYGEKDLITPVQYMEGLSARLIARLGSQAISFVEIGDVRHPWPRNADLLTSVVHAWTQEQAGRRTAFSGDTA